MFDIELEKRRQAKREEEHRIKLEQELEIQKKFEKEKKRKEMLAHALLPELRGGQVLPTLVLQSDHQTEISDDGDISIDSTSQLSLPSISS